MPVTKNIDLKLHFELYDCTPGALALFSCTTLSEERCWGHLGVA